MSVIIDRRLNDRNKSAVNRERFMRRYKSHIQRAVTDMVAERSITDMEQGGDVRIPVKDISEPTFRHGAGGDREYVHTGNREFMPGDRIERPQSGGGGGGGDAGGEGSAEDSFVFTLSREEFMQIFFDDLELPRLARTALGEIRVHRMQRAGYTTQGSPVNLSVPRSLRNALGRRIALSGEARRTLAQREAELAALAEMQAFGHLPHAPGNHGAGGHGVGGHGHAHGAGSHGHGAGNHGHGAGNHGHPGGGYAAERARLEAEIEALRRRVGRVPFLDEIDLRYRHRVAVPQPVSQAVMFCLMDVSASMDEHRKDLAKRFFALLHMFLARKYERVEVVFIRHTDDAEEVDEDRFFHDRMTGGTVVYSALELMRRIVAERYPVGAWNIYGAQASDGDAFGADPERSRGLLERELLPSLRHFAYVEVNDEDSGRVTTLSSAYRRIEAAQFAMREVHERRDIYPVFRGLFAREVH